MPLYLPSHRPPPFQSFLWGVAGFLVRSVLFGVIPLVGLATAITHFDVLQSARTERPMAAYLHSTRPASHTVREIRVAEDGRSVWVTRFPAIVEQVDLQTGAVLRRATVPVTFASDLQLTSPQRHAVVYMNEKGTNLQALGGASEPVIIPMPNQENIRVAVDPIHDVIAIGHDQTITLRSLTTIAKLQEVTLSHSISRLQWSADGSQLLTVLTDGTLQLLDGRTLAIRQSQQTSFVGDTKLTWPRDGQHAAICTNAGTFAVWDLARNELKRFQVDTRFLHAAALSPDGRWLAYPDAHDQVWLQSVGGEQEVRCLGTSCSLVSALCFTADGQALLIGGMDGHLECWSVMDGAAGWSTPFASGPSLSESRTLPKATMRIGATTPRRTGGRSR
ncbi:MAG: WD40 repeat domain-containing protein [Planctomycetaceae bacterium]|nr:WD40 repeat domain-containing protein [Planctomycetaceae bacterium]